MRADSISGPGQCLGGSVLQCRKWGWWHSRGPPNLCAGELNRRPQREILMDELLWTFLKVYVIKDQAP